MKKQLQETKVKAKSGLKLKVERLRDLTEAQQAGIVGGIIAKSPCLVAGTNCGVTQGNGVT